MEQDLSQLLVRPAPGVLRFGAARMALLDMEAGFWGIRRQMEAAVGSQQASLILQQAGANGGASFAASLGRARTPAEQAARFEQCVQAYQSAGFGRFAVEQAQWPIGRVTVRAADAIEAWMMQRHGQQTAAPACAYTAGVLVGFVNVISDRRDVVCIERRCQALGDEACVFELLPAAEARGHEVIAFTPDPALGRDPAPPPVFNDAQLRETLARLAASESLLRSVIENARHFAIYRVQVDPANPYHGRVALASPSLRELSGIEDIYDFSAWFANLHPEDAPRIVEANRRALEQGAPYNQVARVYHPREGRWRWVQTISNPGFDAAGRLTHFDGMVIDLTDQKEAELALQAINATLEQRVRERTEEVERRRAAAESLHDIIGMINANLPLDELLRRALELAAQRLGAAGAVLHHLDVEHEVITQLASYGLEGIFADRRSRPFSALRPSGGEAYLRATLQKQPTCTNYPPLPERLDEIRRDPAIPDAIKAERIRLRERYAASFSVPLFIQDKVFGGMVFYYTEPQEFREDQIQLGLAFAEQMALAIENARLLEETGQRRRVAESLRETLSILNTEQPLDDILAHIVAQAQGLLGAKAVAVHRLDRETGLLSPQAAVGLSTEYATQIRLPLGQGALGRAVVTRQPVAVYDTTQVFVGATVHAAGGEPIALEGSLVEKLQRFSDRYGAVLAVPMTVQGQVYGGLVLYYAAPRAISPDEVQLAVTFANQAALAIENALLRSQAAEAARLAERGRLARDLHDAVTQTLFSASLIADVLPRLWERDAELGRQKLAELRLLTRGALSEMRTLLLELRPDALAEVELGDLCRHLANAFSGRTRVPVAFAQEGPVSLPPPVKETFYRVAQEALNNIAKHAAATQVALRLQGQEGHAEMTIRDDGVGFAPSDLTAENLGLQIMRERAAAIGAQLAIESAPGAGTTVRLWWHEDVTRGA